MALVENSASVRIFYMAQYFYCNLAYSSTKTIKDHYHQYVLTNESHTDLPILNT